jgi:hypothetical protein
MTGTLRASSKGNRADMDILGLILFHRTLKASTPCFAVFMRDEAFGKSSPDNPYKRVAFVSGSE